MHSREAGEAGAPVALLVHGYPNTSYLWKDVLPAVAAAGYRAVAPDLPGYGDSELDGSTGTWAEHVAALDAFVTEHGLAPVALVVHDWGGLIGLRWACEHPDAISALVIADTGFFPDGKWHGLALAMRTEGQGEELMANMTRDTLSAVLRSASPQVTEAALDEYFKAFSTPERRAAQLALYRSGDFEELSQYEGALAAMDVPTKIIWGARDEFAPVASAHRFAKEIPHAELVVLDEAGHFIQEDAPERVAQEVGGFLAACHH
jgi:haloalkane dehalogenase